MTAIPPRAGSGRARGVDDRSGASLRAGLLPSGSSPSVSTPDGAAIPRARPLSEWAEEDGDVLWWRFPIEEPPYCGSPLDCGRSIRIVVDGVDEGPSSATYQVGGWPGYHTHWTPFAVPAEPVIDPAAMGADLDAPQPSES